MGRENTCSWVADKILQQDTHKHKSVQQLKHCIKLSTGDSYWCNALSQTYDKRNDTGFCEVAFVIHSKMSWCWTCSSKNSRCSWSNLFMFYLFQKWFWEISDCIVLCWFRPQIPILDQFCTYDGRDKYAHHLVNFLHIYLPTSALSTGTSSSA